MPPFKLIRINKMSPSYKPPKAQLASSYQFFCDYLRHRMGFGHSPMPTYKHYILQTMQDCSYGAGYTPSLLIMEPRSHAKTTIDIEPYAAWRWLKEPHLRVGVWSAGEQRAKRITQGIIRIISKYLPEYYDVEYEKTLEIRLRHNRPYDDPSVECFPILGGSSVGSGKDIIICDDVYTTESIDYSAGGYSEIKADKIIDRFERISDLNREYPYPLRITVGTPVHINDLYNRIELGKLGLVKILKFPIVPEEYIKLLPPPPITMAQAQKYHKYLIWPDIFPIPKFMEKYNSPARWHSQYMLQPESQADAVFLRENLQYVQETVSVNAFKKLILSVDPASPKQFGQKGDKCAIVVGGITKDNSWHIVDGWAQERYKVEEVIEVWKHLVYKWSTVNKRGWREYPETIIELQGQQELFFAPLQLASSAAPFNGHTPIRPQTTGGVKKSLRIEGFLSVPIAQRKFYIHRSPIAQELIKELEGFPGYPHKDIADASAAMIKYCARMDDYWYPMFQGLYSVGDESQ